MMNMNDSHDSRNDDDDDIKFISNKKDNNYKNILFTPQIPKMERKNSHRKAFQHLQRLVGSHSTAAFDHGAGAATEFS